jgi:hypothetical protein
VSSVLFLNEEVRFLQGMIHACYMVFNGEGVDVNAKLQSRRDIELINEAICLGIPSDRIRRFFNFIAK